MRTMKASIIMFFALGCMLAFAQEPPGSTGANFNGKWQMVSSPDVTDSSGKGVHDDPCILTITVKGDSAKLDYSPGLPDTGKVQGNTLTVHSTGRFKYTLPSGGFIKTFYKANVTMVISDDGRSITKTKLCVLPEISGHPKYTQIEIWKRIN